MNFFVELCTGAVRVNVLIMVMMMTLGVSQRVSAFSRALQCQDKHSTMIATVKYDLYFGCHLLMSTSLEGGSQEPSP